MAPDPRYGLSWISERVHLDSLDDQPWQRLRDLADEEGMFMGDYVVQYGPDGHLYTFSDITGEVRLDRKEAMVKITASITFEEADAGSDEDLIVALLEALNDDSADVTIDRNYQGD